MSQVLTLELNDEMYTALKQQAEASGLPLSEWITRSLEQCCVPTRQQTTDAEIARQRFRNHAGAFDLGYATGAENESIDADLIRAYSDEQEM